ncbi:MAG: recombinase family protein [Limisphaerales bacterium]
MDSKRTFLAWLGPTAIKVFPIIQEIKSAGVETLQGICDCLNRRGIPTRNGKNWYPATVRNILKIQDV